MDLTPAVSYRRVSTTDQSDHGYSLPKQQEYNDQYARSNQLDIVADFVEDVSGMVPIEDRPEGRKMLDFLQRRGAVALLVHESDRLSRDIVNLLGTVQRLLRAGVQIHITDVGHVQSELDIVLVIRAWQGGSEHARIKERLMRGRVGKAQSGKWVGGTPPYGYRSKGALREAHLVVHEPEAEIVRRIFQWYTSDRLNMMVICNRLNESGVPTQRGTKWWKGIVKKILSNESYAGVFYFMEVRIELPELSIVSPETFESAQAQRQRNRERAVRNRKRDYLLLNHFRCQCGSTMTGATSVNAGHDRLYYRCMQFVLPSSRRDCPLHAPMASGFVVEQMVWGFITRLIEDEELLSESVQAVNADRQANADTTASDVETLDRKISAAGRKIERLLREFGDEADEETAKSLKGLVREAQRERDTAKAKLALTVEERTAREGEDLAQADVLARARSWRGLLGQADFKFKREVLDALGVRIVFQHDADGERILTVSTVLSLPKSLPYLSERRYKKVLRLGEAGKQ